METLFESLFDGGIMESSTDNILNDTHLEDSIDASIEISGGEHIEPSILDVENTFETDDFNVDAQFGMHENFSEIEDTESVLLESEIGESIESIDAVGDAMEMNNDDLLTPVNVPELAVAKDDIELLRDKAAGIDRDTSGNVISFGKKVCPTRHGCTGATYCDSCGSDYPY